VKLGCALGSGELLEDGGGDDDSASDTNNICLHSIHAGIAFSDLNETISSCLCG
jgi:hypothetical protein